MSFSDDLSQPEWLIPERQRELAETADPLRRAEIEAEIEAMRTHPWPP